MKTMSKQNREQAVAILCRAFEHNRGINWLIGKRGDKTGCMRRLMEYSVLKSLRNGGAYISDDGSGVILIERPGRDKTSIGDLIRLLEIVVRVIGVTRAGEVSRREAYMKNAQPGEDHVRLLFIAVDPERQNRGVGKRLLREFLDANTGGLTVCLETSSESNLLFYGKFGFHIHDTWSNPSAGFPLWLLRRVAQ